MADEFDKPLEHTDANDYGEDAEVPLLPHPAEPAADHRDRRKEAHDAKRYIQAAGKGLIILSVWLYKRGTSANFWNALATVFIAIATIVYTVYAGRQWREIHDSSTDTHNLAEAAKKKADKAETIFRRLLKKHCPSTVEPW